MNKQQLSEKFAEMCNYGLDQFPSSITLSLVRRATAIANAAAPGWFIEYIGPFFWDKRREIAADDLNYFLDRSWSEQYASWGFLGSALSQQWEATIKDGIRHVHAKDPQILRTVSRSLVAMYSRYIQLCQ